MALLTDGLWISGVELSIDRDDAPIPDAMKNIPLKMRLTPTQFTAIAAVLGLGLDNGNIVCYRDDALDRFMKDPKNSLIEDKYRLMTSKDVSERRIAAKAFSPLVESKKGTDIWNAEGFIDDDITSIEANEMLEDNVPTDQDGASE